MRRTFVESSIARSTRRRSACGRRTRCRSVTTSSGVRLVADCVVAPEHTRLLARAADHGAAVHTGVPMLAAQMELMLRFVGVD